MAFADFQALYKQKLTTADEAVKVIKSGDWVDYGFLWRSMRTGGPYPCETA